MAAEGGNIVFIYTGAEGERIPDGVTHVTIGKDVTFVRARAFYQHPNIIELICHDKVEKVEEWAFGLCPSLRRIIMPGVEIAEMGAFSECEALTDVECGKLEIIVQWAFYKCTSLGSINLPSARILEENTLAQCAALIDVKFGRRLQRLGDSAFYGCESLERITIPLKDDLMIGYDTFQECQNLKHVDLIEGALLKETVAALQLENWRNDMNTEIDSINQILPNASAGFYYGEGDDDYGQKALVIQRWIRSVLEKMMLYRAQHKASLGDAATTLQLALPRDIVMNNVLPFLELPSYTV